MLSQGTAAWHELESHCRYSTDRSRKTSDFLIVLRRLLLSDSKIYDALLHYVKIVKVFLQFYRPAVKNSSSITLSMLGLAVGSARSNFVIRLRAGRLIRGGMWYSFFLILMYVSFRQVVSNGGFPTSRVNLKFKTVPHETFLLAQNSAQPSCEL